MNDDGEDQDGARHDIPPSVMAAITKVNACLQDSYYVQATREEFKQVNDNLTAGKRDDGRRKMR